MYPQKPTNTIAAPRVTRPSPYGSASGARDSATRRIALDNAERARRVEADAEKARVGMWFRWIATTLVTLTGAAIAQALGIHG